MFELNEKEIETLTEWQSHLNALFEKRSSITYSFTHSGIGTVCEVSCVVDGLKISKDITDYGSW